MNQPLKIAIINHSDTLGGASVVAYRLMNALRVEGHDARMVVYTRVSESPNVAEAAGKFMRSIRFLHECLATAWYNGFSRRNLFTASVAVGGTDLSKDEWVMAADVIILNWVNQGLLSIGGLKKLLEMGKPVVWIMHDMWPMTGVCHHAHECDGFKDHCGHCPLLKGGKRAKDYSYELIDKKRNLYNSRKITFVAVSNWIAQKAAESTLLKNQDVRVIPNAFPLNSFVTKPVVYVQSFNLDYTKNMIMMVAARLDDPIKGLEYAISALNKLFDEEPDVAKSSMAVFVGAFRDPGALSGLKFPYRYLGRVEDPQLLVNLYAASKVVISTSLYETLPGTLIEGQASGCVPVTFGEGGQSDIVDHKVTGYIAEYKSSEDVARGIKWALDSSIDRQFLREEVRKKFDSRRVAGEYTALFEELLSKK